MVRTLVVFVYGQTKPDAEAKLHETNARSGVSVLRLFLTKA